MKVQMSVTVDQELLNAIDRLAEIEGRTRSNMVERILSGYVRDNSDQIDSKDDEKKRCINSTI